MEDSNNMLPNKTETSGSAVEEEKVEVSLSATSKTAFNDRAWNDPPDSLLMSKSKQHVDTPRTKLTTRVAYPMGGDSKSTPGATLNASAPPPTAGFVSASMGSKTKPPLAVPPKHPPS